MRKLTLDDLKPLNIYEAMRPAMLQYIIDLRNRRRLPLGDLLTLSFENRDTVLFQIQEMARVENITAPEKLQEELDAYNPLIPEQHTLKATLFIEIPDQAKIKETLDKLLGLDNHVMCVKIGSEQVFFDFEPGHSKEERISAVHFVSLHLTEEQVKTWRELSEPPVILVNHPNYRAEAALPKLLHSELTQDLLTDNEH